MTKKTVTEVKLGNALDGRERSLKKWAQRIDRLRRKLVASKACTHSRVRPLRGPIVVEGGPEALLGEECLLCLRRDSFKLGIGGGP